MADDTYQETLVDPVQDADLDWLDVDDPRASDELGFWGIDSRWLGQSAADTKAAREQGVKRTMVSKQYWYPRREKAGGDIVYAPLQFRVFVYHVADLRREFVTYLREHTNPRLRTVFNTAGGGQHDYSGYMAGFMDGAQTDPLDLELAQEVGLREADVLGVPQFSVEVYDEDGVDERNLRGIAQGFVNPWTVETETTQVETGKEPPQEEVWKMSYNQSRDKYDIHPSPGTARRRTRDDLMRGKRIYINDRFVGTVDKEGRGWLTNDYKNSLTWTSPQTGRERWSREGLVERTGATWSALRDGGNLYKTEETSTEIRLYTAAEKPTAGYDPLRGDEVSEAAVGVTVSEAVEYDLDLDENDPDHFRIVHDENKRPSGGGALGFYPTPADRHIEEGTYWVDHT